MPVLNMNFRTIAKSTFYLLFTFVDGRLLYCKRKKSEEKRQIFFPPLQNTIWKWAKSGVKRFLLRFENDTLVSFLLRLEKEGLIFFSKKIIFNNFFFLKFILFLFSSLVYIFLIYLIYISEFIF